MQKYIIEFFGKDTDITLAGKLCDLCLPKLELQADAVVVAPDEKEYKKDVNIAYCFNSEIQLPKDKKAVTYYVGNGNADICALNFQKRETSRSLELLCNTFMGRVNIPLKSEFSERAVLYCACGLYAAGAKMPEILKVINEVVR